MINTAVINISILLVLLLNTVSGHMQYDLIGNSTTVNVTTSALKLDRNGKKVYQYAQHLHGLLIVPTSKYILEHIIKNQILTTHQIETLNNRTDIIFTIFDDPLTQLYTEYLLTIQRPTQNFGVISNHDITNGQYRHFDIFKSTFGGTNAGIKRIILWLTTHNSALNTNNIDRTVAYDLFKEFVKECKLSYNLLRTKWLKKGTMYFCGHSLHNLIDKDFKRWIKTLKPTRKQNRKRTANQVIEENQEAVSAQIIQQLTGVQDTEQQQPIIPDVQSRPNPNIDYKAEYLRTFDVAQNGDIMEQDFVKDNLIKFFKAEEKSQWKDSIIYVEESNVRRIFIGTYKQKEEHKNLENQDEDLNDEKEEHKNLDRDDNKQKQKHKNLEIQDEDLNDANIVEYVSRGRSHIHISGRFSKHKLQGLTLKPT
eukprot:1351_1